MQPTNVLRQYCQNALFILQSQYQATRLLQHNATAGSTREQIIKDFLVNHLPELVSVVSGQIFDSKSNFSRQQDIVLVLKSMARLPFARGNDLIFQEGVVATIEIKTNLNASVLQTIGENIRSVRLLSASIGASAQLGITHSWPSDKLLTAIISYEGASMESFDPTLAQMDEPAKPDLILDLGKGLFVRNHGLLLPQNGTSDYLSVPEPALGFMHFLTFLTEITGTISSRGVLWRSYWG
jgi:hypothetical protein